MHVFHLLTLLRQIAAWRQRVAQSDGDFARFMGGCVT
jgi:hypothetical protein